MAAAKTERQSYAVASGEYRLPPNLKERLNQTRSIESAISTQQLERIFCVTRFSGTWHLIKI